MNLKEKFKISLISTSYRVIKRDKLNRPTDWILKCAKCQKFYLFYLNANRMYDSDGPNPILCKKCL